MWGLVAIPAVAILVCGILILVYQQSVFDVTMGLLLVTFCVALGAGAAVTLFGLRADRRLVALQIDFLSKVSHELRTPLTSIQMFVETLRLGRVKDPEKVEHCLEVINKETERLSALIQRLLSWGSMEAGAFRVDLQPRLVSDLVQAAIDAFQPQLLRADATIEVVIDEGLPRVAADQAALVDAILNLLNNALKYGGTERYVRLHAHMRDGSVAITVRDRGIGIDLREQRRIFERFYRSAAHDAHNIPGTGLGLAIVRHVVEAHGGTVEVESEPEKGSAFTIVLPSVTP